MKQRVALIKYNAGNIRSVFYALERAGVEPIITDDHKRIAGADKVVFPGDGEAHTTMEYLKKHGLNDLIISLKQPVLGICIGMQLMCRFSDERSTQCLEIFDNHIHKFQATKTQKVPHMGWNKLFDVQGPIFDSRHEGKNVYFVHSYYAPVNEDTSATCEYINPFSAALQRDNFFALQFHPEKSGVVGAQMLDNFLKL